MTPEMTAAAAKGVPGFVAGNLTPEPTLLPTLVQAPLVTPVPIPPDMAHLPAPQCRIWHWHFSLAGRW